MCAQDTPDLVLMDLIMPGMDGVEATRRIMAATPCAILIVTASVGANAQRVFEAMGHGALDAVDTPALGAGTARDARGALLAKIDDHRQADRRQARPAARRAGTRRRGRPCDASALVAIGASAGGPAALAKLLRGLPADFPAAIVIVQHVDEQFAAGMADWLNAAVAAAGARGRAKATAPCPATCCSPAPRDHLACKAPDRLGYTPDPVDYVYRPSVDVFFDSVCRTGAAKRSACC